ncbi:hypothetical protein HWI79_1342 [Cryptosporidium felis]|nr:hypothetical protein HWI79_1342 [Cryptosporidium felis]
MVGTAHSSTSTSSRNIEKMINSSLDDIVKEARREKQMKRSGGSQVQGRNGKAQETRKKGAKKPNSVNLNARGGFKGSPNRNSRAKSANGGGGRSERRRTARDQMRNIQIVAKLDGLPTPTAQQKAGMNNLEVIPSSISSQKARRSRVFG